MSSPVSITASCPPKILRPATGATTARVTPSDRLTAMVEAFAGLGVEAVLDEGLHEFLTRFIREMVGVAALVHEDYLSGVMR